MKANEAMARAVQLHQSGNLGAAEGLYGEILKSNPAHAGAWGMLGLLEHQTGRNPSALQKLDKALTLMPRNPQFHFHRGVVLHALGRGAESLESLHKAVKLDPRNGESHLNLAIGLQEAGRPTDALKHAKEAAKRAAKNPQVHNLLGTLLGQTGDLAGAEKALKKALAMAPLQAKTMIRQNLIQVLGEARKLDEAVKLAQENLKTNLGNPRAEFLLGKMLNLTENFSEALPHLRSAAAKVTGALEIETELANALKGIQDYDAARVCYETLLRKQGDIAGLHYNLGQIHKECGRLDDALTAFDRALKLDPDYLDAHNQRGSVFFLQGRFSEGFSDWEWRWKGKERPVYPQPPWTGQSLTDKSIMVWGEQGIGDEILYLGMVPRLAETAEKCFVSCEPRLRDLVARAHPDWVMTDKPRQAQADFQVPLGDLLVHSPIVPSPSRYLEPDPERVANCRKWLDRLAEPKRIGIAWRSKRANLGRLKTMDLAHWKPILEARDTAFINLQYGETAEEIETVRGGTSLAVHTHPDIDRFNDINGLAALIETLDMVITTSNVTAHIAGALGKPCWLLVGKTPLWYWGREGKTTPFYPSLTVFRQETVGNWESVVKDVAAALKNI